MCALEPHLVSPSRYSRCRVRKKTFAVCAPAAWGIPFSGRPKPERALGGYKPDRNKSLTSEEAPLLTNGTNFGRTSATLVAAEVEGALEFAANEVAKLQDSLAELASEDSIASMGRVAGAIVSCLRSGGKVLFCGNGGSAADAQHLAAELVGRQNYDRSPAAGIALSVDTSVLTAISNDYSYDNVFSRQVEAIGRPGDALVGISTSGRSKNVVNALAVARSGEISTVAMTGRDPREMAGADFVLAMPASETAKVQELQLVAGHIIFGLVERALFPRPAAATGGEQEFGLRS
jgi:D-sedoheptulose 7-phosphate isomerase